MKLPKNQVNKGQLGTAVDKINCLQLAELLSLYIDTADQSEIRKFSNHMKTCKLCRGAYLGLMMSLNCAEDYKTIKEVRKTFNNRL